MEFNRGGRPAPDRCTVFRLYFPVLEEEAPSGEDRAEAAPSAAQGGTGTVLLVEDEEELRDLLSAELEDLGYRVVSASDPAEALKLAGAEGGRIDLLLTDVVLPLMNGPQAAEALRRIQPGLKVLYMSGYPEHQVTGRSLLGDEDFCLEKPFSTEELALRVRTALGS